MHLSSDLRRCGESIRTRQSQLIGVNRKLPMSDPSSTIAQVSSPHIPSWHDYLPAVLQEGPLYWIGTVNLASVGIFQTFPPKYRQPWIVQLGTFFISLLFSFWLIGLNVYTFGISLIASWMATSFYDLAFSSLTSWIRRVLGAPTCGEPTFDSSAPRPSTPQSVIEKP